MSNIRTNVFEYAGILFLGFFARWVWVQGWFSENWFAVMVIFLSLAKTGMVFLYNRTV
ncbi:hypothetical protein [Runella slithyformis]|uniref:hypothetical protein n=1 Tax=Runella slithyformis TaxID=106 RepID=UPI0003066599|nr:hypothetical protein [Runella slithyformis]